MQKVYKDNTTNLYGDIIQNIIYIYIISIDKPIEI